MTGIWVSKKAGVNRNLLTTAKRLNWSSMDM